MDQDNPYAAPAAPSAPPAPLALPERLRFVAPWTIQDAKGMKKLLDERSVNLVTGILTVILIIAVIVLALWTRYPFLLASDACLIVITIISP